MKEQEVRLTATGIIWLAFTIVTLGALAASDHVSTTFIFVLTLMFTMAAITSTRMIWRYGNTSTIPVERSEKVKRRTRVEQVLDTMSDSELDELRSRLGDSDGEAVGLDELLAERGRERR